jgi:hypothetical protein
MVVVLFSASNEEPNLQPAALAELRRLGVTSVSFLRDESIAGLVLEGWAFDSSDASEAACLVAGACEGVRTLHPLLHVAVAADPTPVSGKANCAVAGGPDGAAPRAKG